MQWTFGLIGAILLLSVFPAAQEKQIEIKLTIKYNDHTVPNPDHITLSSDGYVAKVAVTNGKFNVPAELAHAKTWNLAAVIIGNQIQIFNLSQGDLEYEIWTLYLADHRYNGKYASAVPKGAEIRSSCMLVLDSQFVDPGVTIFQTHCRKKLNSRSDILRETCASGPPCGNRREAHETERFLEAMT